MSFFPQTTYGGFGFPFGGYPYAQPVEKPADPDAKAKPGEPTERLYTHSGPGLWPGYDKAPPWNLADAWEMYRYSAVQAALAAIVCPIMAATRTVEVRNKDGTNAKPKAKPGPMVEGDQLTPEDKLAKAIEQHLEPRWSDVLTGLKCVHFGWWDQEVVWDRVDTDEGELTLPVSFRDFLPGEASPLVDKQKQFAGVRYSGQAGKPVDLLPPYVLHNTEEGSLDPIFGWGRSRNAWSDWWRVIQSHLNGDRLERKASGISLLISVLGAQGFTDLNTNATITNDQIAQKIANALSSGGTIALPMSRFTKEAIEKNPELAKIPAAQAQQFDWGQTGPAMLAQIARADHLDAMIVRGYRRKERTMFEGEHGTKAEAGVHKSSDELDSEQVHAAMCRQFSQQTLNTLLVTNKGPEMRDRLYIKPGPLSDDTKAWHREIAGRLATSPMSPLGQMIDHKELGEKSGLPLDPNYKPMPALAPGMPPGGAGARPGANGNGNGRMKALGLSGRGIRPFAGRLALAGGNCGTGAGGFKPGNKCQRKQMGRALDRLGDLTGPKKLNEAFPDDPRYAGGTARHAEHSPAVRTEIGTLAGELAKDAMGVPPVEAADRKTLNRAYLIDLSEYPEGLAREGIAALADKAGRIAVEGQPTLAIVTAKGDAGKLLRGMQAKAGGIDDVLIDSDPQLLWDRSAAAAVESNGGRQYKPLTDATWLRGGKYEAGSFVSADRVPAEVRGKSAVKA